MTASLLDDEDDDGSENKITYLLVSGGVDRNRKTIKSELAFNSRAPRGRGCHEELK